MNSFVFFFHREQCEPEFPASDFQLLPLLARYKKKTLTLRIETDRMHKVYNRLKEKLQESLLTAYSFTCLYDGG